jgi:hypothetical protein
MKQGCAIYSFLTTDGDNYVQESGYRVSIRSWSDVSIRSLHDPVVVRLTDGPSECTLQQRSTTLAVPRRTS